MYFSVVIPIYNVERYLKQCIDSVLQQSFKDYEIILVDDGSPDRCPHICDEYADKYNNIRVIHKENGGLSDARNAGTHIALGKFICYLDSDDYWDRDDVLENYYEKSASTNVDIIIMGVKKVSENGSIIADIPPNYERFEQYEGEELYKQLVINRSFRISACLMALKRSFIIQYNLYFKKGIKTEDLEWALRVFECKPVCAFFSKNAYAYRKGREGSITSSVDYQHIVDYSKIIRTALCRLDNNNDIMLKETLISYIMYHELIIIAHLGSLKCPRERKKVLEEDSRSVCKKYLTHYKLDQRVKYAALIYTFFGYRFLQSALVKYLEYHDMRGL